MQLSSEEHKRRTVFICLTILTVVSFYMMLYFISEIESEYKISVVGEETKLDHTNFSTFFEGCSSMYSERYLTNKQMENCIKSAFEHSKQKEKVK